MSILSDSIHNKFQGDFLAPINLSWSFVSVVKVFNFEIISSAGVMFLKAQPFSSLHSSFRMLSG